MNEKSPTESKSQNIMDCEDKTASCDNFTLDTSTSSQVFPANVCGKKKKEKKELVVVEAEKPDDPSCSNLISTSSSSTTTFTLGDFDSGCRLHKTVRPGIPNIQYELNIAKAAMQQYSTLSGDNLFDHLSDIIKRVIDEKPPNVIDFFEEFSRNVREQKFHLPERFPPDAIFDETRMYRVAKQILTSMKLPYTEEPQEHEGEEEEQLDVAKESFDDEFGLILDDSMRLFITFNERVQQLQFYWNQCGFSISTDDIFQLASAMNRLQTHPSIMQCRFWGCMNGLRASYYIVEALLTREEMGSRLTMMEEELREKQLPLKLRKVQEEKPPPPHIGPELTPGIYGWETFAPEELAKMKPAADPVPLVQEIEFFDVPPEYIGLGCNRYSYFVVNNLYDDWIELPIVTPRQLVVSRQIKKFLTGDLEADIVSYPCFPGKEKHYLRALITRITAGTYIAPQGYYRRMTKKEKRLFDGIELEGEEEEEEEEEDNMDEEGEAEEIIDNDVMLLKNEKYEAEPLVAISTPVNWVHVRPNILNQGRVVWFDEEKARKEREKALALYFKMRLAEEMEEEEEEEEEEDEEEGDEEGMLEGFNQPEIGPNILSSCANDISDQFTVPWVARFTSKYTNKKERVLIMQSNVWPGAFSFSFEDVCESIYLGWGHKYVARNMPFKHLALMQEEYPHTTEDFIEATDPSVEDEEAYRQWLLRRQKHDDIGEDLGDDDDEFAGQYDDDTEV